MKEARRWDGVVSREEAAVLDHSEMSAGNGVNGGQAGGEFKPDVSSTVLFSAQSVKSLEITLPNTLMGGDFSVRCNNV